MPRRDFPSYGMPTDEGDIAVHRMVTCIVTDMSMGRMRRLELEGRVKLGCLWVTEVGHPVSDVTQGLIEDEVNRACLTLGWERLVSL